METIVAARRPNTRATIRFEDGYPPLPPTAGNQRLLDLTDRISRDIRFGPVTGTDAGRRGRCLVHLGHYPDGNRRNRRRDSADLSVFPALIKRAAILLHRLGRSGPTLP